MNFESDAVHVGREDLEELGVHALPIDLSSTYPIRDLEMATASFDALSAGEPDAPNSVYARMHNPTVHRFERALAALEHAEEAVAFATGMAALTAVLLEARRRGRHIVAIRPLYGGTDHLLDSGLLDVDVSWTTAAGVAAALRHDTSLVLLETPANPTLALADIEAVVEAAGEVPVVVDSTFATPVLQNPIDHGAAMALHSATKAIGGHGDTVGGVVATSAPFARRLRKVRIATGAILHPLAAYQLHRGLQTLPLRVRRAEASASLLAERLLAHPEVERVFYPGLDDGRGLVGRQMRGPGSILAFTLRRGYDAAVRLMREVRLVTPAVSLGSNDTLIQHPAGLTHRSLGDDTRRSCGISEGLLRLSVGIENVEDLWEDLSAALARRAVREDRPQAIVAVALETGT